MKERRKKRPVCGTGGLTSSCPRIEDMAEERGSRNAFKKEAFTSDLPSGEGKKRGETLLLNRLLPLGSTSTSSRSSSKGRAGSARLLRYSPLTFAKENLPMGFEVYVCVPEEEKDTLSEMVREGVRKKERNDSVLDNKNPARWVLLLRTRKKIVRLRVSERGGPRKRKQGGHPSTLAEVTPRRSGKKRKKKRAFVQSLSNTQKRREQRAISPKKNPLIRIGDRSSPAVERKSPVPLREEKKKPRRLRIGRAAFPQRSKEKRRS